MKNKLFNNATGEIILGSQYPYIVENLILGAKESISVMLFYISYNPKIKKSKVNNLVNLLIKAKQKGLKVKVILDKDKEGEVYNSRTINLPTVNLLKNNKIEVHFDNVETANHSKIVVIDNNTVVIGSHNWTLGSFFNYDDTSIKINSVELGKYYSNYIDSQIKSYKKTQPV